MNENEVFSKLEEIAALTRFDVLSGIDNERAKLIASHKTWLQNIRHERPNVTRPYNVGVYIRYFNQTKYDNYLSYHRKQFADSIALCPKWKLVDFYIDKGASTPNMESAPEWSRLLEDCMEEKVNLIITQKVSNVSKNPIEISFCARMLAAQPHPVGIYFISEDIFTLASYYLGDLRDMYFLQGEEPEKLPDDNMTDGSAND